MGVKISVNKDHYENAPVFFYIASGQRYIAEAERSAESVWKCMPEAHTILFTPDAVEKAYFGDVIRLAKYHSEYDYWYLAHSHYMTRAVDTLNDDGVRKAVFMDTDTYMCANIRDVFLLLDDCDFCGAHAPGRYTTRSGSDAPACFPEINIGALGIALNERTAILFRRAFELHKERCNTVYKNNDQGPLRDALWEMLRTFIDFRFHVLPPEYNLRFNQPCFARGEVRILHGHIDNIDAIAREANREKGLRAWAHGIPQSLSG